uniref:Uncharacterized protein n=1 Tax=Acrobeloides nanus TaxID=290746 RepID=A0A914BVX5_9BILA
MQILYFWIFVGNLLLVLITSSNAEHEPNKHDDLSLMDHFMILRQKLSEDKHKEGFDIKGHSIKSLANRLQQQADTIEDERPFEHRGGRLSYLVNHGQLTEVTSLTMPEHASVALNRVRFRDHPDRLQEPSYLVNHGQLTEVTSLTMPEHASVALNRKTLWPNGEDYWFVEIALKFDSQQDPKDFVLDKEKF